jgi:hypothetical protein
LENISKESPDDYWTVMETLTAFVRERAHKKEPAEDVSGTMASFYEKQNPLEPGGWRTDIAAVLTVIKRRDKKNHSRETEKYWRFDLSRTDLQGANLPGADLRAIVHLFRGQRRGHDLASAGIDAEMQFAPSAAGLGTVLLNQPLARTTQLQPGAVDQQVHRLSTRTAAMPLRPRHFQCRRPAAQRGMVRHAQRQAEQTDDGGDEPFGLAKVSRNTARKVSAVRMASGEYQGWPPRVVRDSAAQAAIASAVNQTVRLPR